MRQWKQSCNEVVRHIESIGDKASVQTLIGDQYDELVTPTKLRLPVNAPRKEPPSLPIFVHNAQKLQTYPSASNRDGTQEQAAETKGPLPSSVKDARKEDSHPRQALQSMESPNRTPQTAGIKRSYSHTGLDVVYLT